MSTIHTGRLDGRLNAKSNPVRMALPSASVDGRLNIHRVMAYSTAIHPNTEETITINAPMPKK
jgi:hypothetical protein